MANENRRLATVNIRLREHVSENFKEVFKSILDCEHYMHVLKGGRYSGKSVAVGKAFVLGTMKYKTSACVLMKYQADLKTKAVDNFTFCINELGLADHWKLKQKPWEYVLLNEDGTESNISIRFFGCDDEQNSKGFKSREGEGFKYIWFEEANRFKSWDVVNSIIDTTDRYNKSPSTVVFAYNPPKDEDNWVNQHFIEMFGGNCGRAIGYKTDTLYEEHTVLKAGVPKTTKNMMHHSTYLELIECGKAHWINDNRYVEMERSRECNPRYHAWNYLGAITGSGANILDNVRDWKYDENISSKVQSVLVHYGVDASNMGKDPWHAVKVLWVPDKRDLYILDERVVDGKPDNTQTAYNKYAEVAKAIKELNPYNEFMYGDGAVPANILMLAKDFSLNIRNAKSRHNYSKMAAITWLEGLNNIYIDPTRCPVLYRQLKNWHYRIDPKTDKIDYSKLPDGDDHGCDAVIYALIDYITQYSMGGANVA